MYTIGVDQQAQQCFKTQGQYVILLYDLGTNQAYSVLTPSSMFRNHFWPSFVF